MCSRMATEADSRTLLAYWSNQFARCCAEVGQTLVSWGCVRPSTQSGQVSDDHCEESGENLARFTPRWSPGSIIGQSGANFAVDLVDVFRPVRQACSKFGSRSMLHSNLPYSALCSGNPPGNLARPPRANMQDAWSSDALEVLGSWGRGSVRRLRCERARGRAMFFLGYV